MKKYPLFIFYGENIYGTTDHHDKVPMTSASFLLYVTKQEVEFLMANPEKIEEFYPKEVQITKEKFKMKIQHLIDYSLYEGIDYK